MLNFLFFLLFAIFIPGFVLVARLKLESFFLNLFLSISVGLTLLTLFAYFAGYLEISWLILAYIFFFNALFLINKDYRQLSWPKKIRRLDWLIFFIILAGTLFQNSLTFRSGRLYDFGVGFWGPLGHDGVWHQALASTLSRNFPPQNPIFAGQKLSNYHFFYDLLVAVTAKLTGISFAALIYRFYPLLFSLWLGIGTFFLIRQIAPKKPKAAPLALFFIYFGSSFGWIVEWFKYRNLGGESAFWVNQPVSLNINPPFAISLVFLISLIILFHIFKKRKTLFTSLLIILLGGALIEFKVYAGAIFLAALFMVSLRLFLPTLLLSLVVFWPQNSGAYSLLVVSPFWFIHSMIDFGDRVGWTRLSQARMAYFAERRWLKFFLAEGLGFGIFLAGNLGTRIIGLVALLKKRDFIFWLTLFSFLPPLIFIQKGNPWNTIQFLYYFLFFMSLYAAQILVRAHWLVVAFVLVITPISSIPTFKAGLGEIPPSYISHEELAALNFLRQEEIGTVFTYPFDPQLSKNYDPPYPLFAYSSSAYVSAYAAKDVYFADIVQLEIFQIDYQLRLEAAERFFKEKDLTWSGDFLHDNQISYLYLPKVFSLPMAEEEYPMVKIFENDKVNIYKVE